MLEQLEDVVGLFPGLADAVTELPHDAPLLLVREFVGREIVHEGATLLLGKRDIEAECALVLWYDDGEQDTTPVVAAFSFTYGDDAEDYRGSVARDAYEVLRLLQDGVGEWVDPTPRTKTAFVYS